VRTACVGSVTARRSRRQRHHEGRGTPGPRCFYALNSPLCATTRSPPPLGGPRFKWWRVRDSTSHASILQGTCGPRVLRTNQKRSELVTSGHLDSAPPTTAVPCSRSRRRARCLGLRAWTSFPESAATALETIRSACAARSGTTWGSCSAAGYNGRRGGGEGLDSDCYNSQDGAEDQEARWCLHAPARDPRHRPPRPDPEARPRRRDGDGATSSLRATRT